MKIRKRKKLQLHRETLRALDRRELTEAQGGAPCRTIGENTSGPSFCEACPSLTINCGCM